MLGRFYHFGKPQIFNIDKKNRKIFYKLKHNVSCGPSIVFCRYHEAYKTYIQRYTYDEINNKFVLFIKGKLVKKLIGFDANALYLWCLGQFMPCGKLEMEDALNININDLINDILNNKLFGFFECDIEVPKELYNKFSEMCLIFVNKDY